MTKQELKNIIEDTAKEVLTKNSKALDENYVHTDTVELAVRLSCLTTLKILQKLDVIDKIED